MATKIIPKKSSVADKVPLATDLEVGEIAINLADQKLFSKNASGTVIEVGGSSTDVSFNSVQLTGGTGTQGTLTWDPDGQTLSLDVGNGVSYQYGQELGQTVRNLSGVTITNGSVIKIVGASGDKPTVALADNSSEGDSSTTFAVATEEFVNNSTGRVTTNGLVHDLDTSAFTEGAAIWLGTNGTFTTTKPLSPAHLVHIGWVVRSHATVGIILVRITNGYELEELHDVLITTPSDGQVLSYEEASGLWKNTTPASGSGGATGGGSDELFIENGQTMTTDYTIPATKNAMSTGPITINSGVVLTVSTGARYVVI